MEKKNIFPSILQTKISCSDSDRCINSRACWTHKGLSDPKNQIKDLMTKLREEVELISASISVNSSETDYACDDNVIDKYLNGFKLPPTWEYFLQLLLCNKKVMSVSRLRHAKSVFTTICYVMKKMQTIHHLIRSKHLINILSKLGFSVSYDDLLN